ncbi:Gfo/Idh/MocA family oxidoreductase [Sphingobium sp. H39-3-25]|uniref:Gfo/Idh/MocA family protein n=1 Tax=Sphingobium arseniciresistens TaxID=3030834 RepID=UPI0023B91D7E|nr:Gfo/Idh/MocA family oxidoreductase [Sphingobium arseniciresistens]
MTAIALGLVGIGKIALDQHVPALARSEDFSLAATASRSHSIEGITAYKSVEELLAAEPGITAISLCMPPEPRYAAACAAIAAGRHVMLEKPPGATLSEVEDLAQRAAQRGVTLFTTWHSREAPGVATAKAWLASRRIGKVHITWKEDIRKWHPGQEWILEAGGFGVFDPGINALSILTAILPRGPILRAARLEIPEGRACPIAAQLSMQMDDCAITADFDFLQTGPQSWDIDVETDDGTLRLSHGGATLLIDGVQQELEAEREYGRLYDRFAALVRQGESDVDVAPLRLIADAMMLGERTVVEPFAF